MQLTKRGARALGVIAAIIPILAAAPAWAHIGVGPASGLAVGLLHPLFGLDHLLVMLAVGVWAGQLGGRARLALPLAFLCLIAVGMAIGMATPAAAASEALILLSLLAMALLVASEARFRTVWAAGLVGLFALFHGHVHGSEVPATASGLGYGLGVLAATALLIGAGLALQLGLRRLGAGWGGRAIGLLALAGAGGLALSA